MRKSKASIKALVAISAVLVVALFAFAGCAPQAPSAGSGGSQAETSADAADPTAPYTSDEACLACHGGSYEAHAQETAQYGEWNPHASIHGGYNSCDNCHERGQELTRNWCSNCHTYSAEGSTYYEEPLVLAPVE